MKKYDAIIIGSGLGGLACGATLAKKGRKVLILEQHDLIGGCATCFPRKGVMIDAGLHEIDFGHPSIEQKYFIFDQLGLWEKVTFVPLPTAWTIRSGDRQYTIPHGNTKEALKKMFPHETSGIDRYFKMIHYQAKKASRFPFDMKFFHFFFAPITTLPTLFFNAITNRTTGNILDNCIKDPKLKHILNINITYYHHNPYRFIWSFHAIPQSAYYTQGMYVKGGSQALSNGFVSIITDHHGEVKNKADVKHILLKENRAIGVRYLDKTTKEEIEVYADKIIANCDPAIVYEELLPKTKDYSADLSITKNFERTTSLVSIYMVFDKKPNDLYPDMDYSTFIVKPNQLNKSLKETDCEFLSYEDMDFVFVNYSRVDSGLSNRDDRHVGVITAYGKYEDWDNLDKESYRAKKAEIQKILEDRLEATFPGLMAHCIHSELATPKTIERYIRTRKGTPYGYDQNQEGYRGRERFKSKSVKNLYFASAFGFPGGGFTGAILGGYRTARKILDPYAWPRKLALSVLFGFALSEGIKFLLTSI